MKPNSCMLDSVSSWDTQFNPYKEIKRHSIKENNEDSKQDFLLGILYYNVINFGIYEINNLKKYESK